MHLSGRNKGPMVAVVDKPSKLFSYDNGERSEEQVRNHLVANEGAFKLPIGNDAHVNRFSKNRK